MNGNPHRQKQTDSLLYFQIALSAVLALALLIINYEKPKPEFENVRVRISGLQVRAVRHGDGMNRTAQPPEIKKMKKN